MGSRLCILLACALAAVALTPAGRADTRDDTATLQAELDAGGNVFLPKLPNGQCYATRGLWLSQDDTTVTSDGACIVALGWGEPRLKTPAGKPIYATSVFVVDHSKPLAFAPDHVTISGLDIRVPQKTHMTGITFVGDAGMLDHVSVSGAPVRDVVVGSGRPGLAYPSERIAIENCTFTGGIRDLVSVYGPMDFRFEGNLLSGEHRRMGAGLHLISADRGQPMLDVRIAHNVITDNAGSGIRVDLDPTNGLPVLADNVDVESNVVLRNARAGVEVAGGEDDGNGHLVLANNVVRFNRGPGILGHGLRLAISATANDLRGNRGGATKGFQPVSAAQPAAAQTWTPPASVLTDQPNRDDTSWLQARLDARGGTIFLPKLPDGQCYATHGLWVSHDDTTITSDGACITSLGPGPVRLHSSDGDAIASQAVFEVSRTNEKRPAPVRIAISNLQIVVPTADPEMYGVAVFASEVTLTKLQVSGYPKDDVIIGGSANGFAARDAVLDSTLSGARRNGVTAFGVVGLRLEGNTIEGVRDSPPGQPAAGIDIEPDARWQPTLDVHVLGNLIQDNAGPGILLPLDTNLGEDLLASGIEIGGNTIVRNSGKLTPPTRAGIAVVGGQDGGGGTLALTNNVIRDNGGPGILGRLLELVVAASGNQFSGNEDGDTQGIKLGR